MIQGLLFLALSAGVALATWNADKTGEIQVRAFSLLERQKSPNRFRLYLNLRFALAALFAAMGALTFLPPAISN